MDLGTLFAKISLDSKDFSKGLDKTLSGLSAITTASGVASTALAGLFVAATAEGLRFAAQLEQLQMGFSTLLGSGSAADDFISSMQEFAARTPFQFEDVTQGARRLMAMGIAADDTLPLLSAIGDRVSAMGGGAFEIQRVITALGQMNAKTRVATQEINQLTEVGISGFGILAKELGKTVPEVIAMVEAREIDSATFLKAFMHTTSDEVGGMMERQATTLIGLVSTLKDRVSMGLADAAKPMIEPLKQAIPIVTDFVGNVIDAVGPLISGLGDVVGVVSQALSAFNALDTETQGAILALGTLATVAPAAITGLIAGIGGLVQAASGLIPVIEMVGTVTTFALSPTVILAFTAAAVMGFGVVSAAAEEMWGAVTRPGETAMDTLDRLGTNVMSVLGPAFDYVAKAASEFTGGFSVASMETQVSFERLAKGAMQVVDQVLTLISVMTGTDLGAAKWATLGEWVGKAALTLMDIGGNIGGAVLSWVMATTSALGPLVVSVGEFVDGLLGLITGTYDAGTAFDKMMNGFVGALASAFNAVVAIVGGTVAIILDLLAGAMKLVPGVDSAGMEAGATQIRDFMAGFSTDLMTGIAGQLGQDVSAFVGGFNMETDAAANTVGTFNMETDAATASMQGYRNSLDDLVGVLSEATGKAKKTKGSTEKKDKEPPKPEIHIDPEFTRLMGSFGDLTPWAGALKGLGIDLQALRGTLMDETMGGRIDLSPEALKQFDAALAKATAALAEFQITVPTKKNPSSTKGIDGGEGLGGKFSKTVDFDAMKEGLVDSVEAMKDFKNSIRDKLIGGLGKLETLINSTVSGFQSGGVWGALIAALVELLISSKQMADISATLDRAFGQIADTLGILLEGVHLVVGNALLLVAQLVGAFAPVLQFVSDIFAGISPLFIVLGVIISTFSAVLEALFSPLDVISGLLQYVFMFLFEVMRFIAQIILSVVWGLQTLWNGMISVVAGIFEGLNKVFGGLDEFISKINSLKVDADETATALNDLTNMTYAGALAQAEQNVTVQDTTESLDAMNAALINVPSGYKVALARFGAMAAGLGGVFGSYGISDIQIPAMASGGVTLGPTLALVGEAGPEAVIPLDRLSQMMRGGGGAGVVITGNIYVTAPDPEAFLTELERIGKRRAANTRGNPMAIQTPFAGVRR